MGIREMEKKWWWPRLSPLLGSGPPHLTFITSNLGSVISSIA